MRKKLDSAGFTLIELLMAMAFFSFILLFMTTGFLIVNRAYNKGISVKLVQDEGRQFVEELTREIRSTDGIDTATKCIYLNGSRYHWGVTFGADPQATGILYKETGKNCSDPVVAPYGELVLHERVGVQHIVLNEVVGGAYELTVILSTSNAEVLTDADKALAIQPSTAVGCENEVGSQYCDLVKYTTIVRSR